MTREKSKMRLRICHHGLILLTCRICLSALLVEFRKVNRIGRGELERADLIDRKVPGIIEKVIPHEPEAKT